MTAPDVCNTAGGARWRRPAVCALGAVVVVVAFACRPELPFGAPCARDSDCADDYVCDDDEDVCVPAADDPNEGEGEGEAGEGEGEEGEGEGESPDPGDVEHKDVTAALGEITAVAMDARGDFVGVAVAIRDDPIEFTQRLELHRMASPSATPDVTIVDPEIGPGTTFIAVAVDDAHTTWIAFNHATPTDNEVRVVAIDVDGATVHEAQSLSTPESGLTSCRMDVAIAPGGDAAVAFKLSDGSFNYARGPLFSVREVAPPGFVEDDYRRVALVFAPDGAAHLMYGVGGIQHAYEEVAGSGVFTSEQAITSNGDTNYMAAAFATDGTLYATFDFNPGVDPLDCLIAWDGSTWSSCEELPAGFNLHAHQMRAHSSGDLVLVFTDASANAPTMLRGPPGALVETPLDDVGIGGESPTLAIDGNSRVLVAYKVDDFDGDGDEADFVRLAIVE